MADLVLKLEPDGDAIVHVDSTEHNAKSVSSHNVYTE